MSTMLTMFPSVARLQESLAQAQADLVGAREEIARLKTSNASTLQAASEEMKRLRKLSTVSRDEIAELRATVTGLTLTLQLVEGKLAGARGRAMRKEKMAQKNSMRSTSQTDELS